MTHTSAPITTIIARLRSARYLLSIGLLGSLAALLLLNQVAYSADQELATKECPKDKPLSCPLQSSDVLASSLTSIKMPELAAPVIPTPIISRHNSGSNPITITYSIVTRGNITSDVATFKTQAQQTFNDSRGWKRLGVRFQPVDTGGSFTLVLASAEQLPSFSSGCSSDYSCRVGRYVIINQDRWEGATTSWNNAGGTLRDYRHMVVNHETGHWLGHGHSSCLQPGSPAPVMQQQSINLQGCSFNAWPLASELRAPNIGLH